MTIEQQAQAEVNEVRAEDGLSLLAIEGAYTAISFKVLIRLNERHEAYRQEVSDAVKDALGSYGKAYDPAMALADALGRFIIAPPVDPLVEAFKEIGWSTESPRGYRPDRLREALAKHGLKIAPIAEGE